MVIIVDRQNDTLKGIQFVRVLFFDIQFASFCDLQCH